MVWSQYVYEANIGFDPVISDDEENNEENTPMNIEEWEVKYSYELWYLWGMINTLLNDAYIEHTMKFGDFVEYCYTEHDEYLGHDTFEYSEQTEWYEERLAYIWKNIRRIVRDNRLTGEMMRGASLEHFIDFSKNYICIY